MNIVLFTHPSFLNSQSMPRFAEMIAGGMIERGHNVEIWTPRPRFYTLAPVQFLKKWFGYVDQFVLFPGEVKVKLKAVPPDTIFVFADQALGPWVPLVSHLPHVIHCHDFLAQMSAQGRIASNPVSFTGRLYQKFIRQGYGKGRNFISVSEKTRNDLKSFLPSPVPVNEVVYNGLNKSFTASDVLACRKMVGSRAGRGLNDGYLLHVGGNQWYKNRTGVIEIYNQWRSVSPRSLPLLLVGESPSEEILQAISASAFTADIVVLTDIKDDQISQFYSGASVFLFPSLAEGFGWPIAEAMASGTVVVTTGEAPMTEVGGDAAFYISRRPDAACNLNKWAREAAIVVEKVTTMSIEERQKCIKSGIANARRFETTKALDKIEAIYKAILNKTEAVQYV